jgi:hypothetical protein
MTIEWLLRVDVVGNSSINNDILPFTILKELEDSETVLYTIMYYEVLKEVWMC